MRLVEDEKLVKAEYECCTALSSFGSSPVLSLGARGCLSVVVFGELQEEEGPPQRQDQWLVLPLLTSLLTQPAPQQSVEEAVSMHRPPVPSAMLIGWVVHG